MRLRRFTGAAFRLGRFCGVWLGVGLLSGCSTASYLWQAGRGQLEIMNRARPIDEVLRDERTSPKLKRLLSEIPRIKVFGEANGLKATGNYVDYVQLDRAAASWVVSGCGKFDFIPRRWSFPIVGSFTYLGWFDIGGARKLADSLKDQGLDVDLRGARAFSTLGWFRDPVLSTMIGDDDDAMGDLVNTVLHESVHATFYVNGQSSFNESIASFVADRMAPQYLEEALGPTDPLTVAYRKAETEGGRRREIMRATYLKLVSLYASSVSETEMQTKKSEILAGAKTQAGLKRDITNATLVQFKTYGTGEAEFTKLFTACGGDWKRFWKAVSAIQTSSFAAPQMEEFGPVVLQVADAGC